MQKIDIKKHVKRLFIALVLTALIIPIFAVLGWMVPGITFFIGVGTVILADIILMYLARRHKNRKD